MFSLEAAKSLIQLVSLFPSAAGDYVTCKIKPERSCSVIRTGEGERDLPAAADAGVGRSVGSRNCVPLYIFIQTLYVYIYK